MHEDKVEGRGWVGSTMRESDLDVFSLSREASQFCIKIREGGGRGTARVPRRRCCGPR